jgi:EAL domain-containing protein (putative c-di-GMP-specific phosphodiesterase class I)/GGDEF domain-containing protein
MQTLQSNANLLEQVGGRDDLLKDLSAHLKMSQSADLRFSFAILKVNKFSQLFYRFGGNATEYALNALVERLIEHLKAGVTIYRLNSEEFAIVFKHRNLDEVNQLFNFLAKPIPYGHDFIDIQLSLGLVDLVKEVKSSEVIRRADIALKLAKLEAFNWQYFNHQMDYSTHADRDMFIELEKAMKNNLLHLAGQPIFDLDTGQVMMVEILLRWQHVGYGAVSPTKIIELASKNGYLSKVALYVAKQLLIFLNEHDDLYRNVSFALNFNMPQIINITLIQALLDSFDDFGIDKSRFIFEATEIDSCPVSLDNVAKQFKWIKNRGIKIAIDDFGSGYSTLNYVNNLDVDIIKIDRSLVCNIETQVRKLETLKALLTLCHKLNVIIVVEGIENISQHHLIKDINITNVLVQGYFYARPSPLTEQVFCDSSYFKKEKVFT